MKITLTNAFVAGDLDPGKTYPHLYITTFTDSPTGTNLSFTYEVGTATSKVVSGVQVSGFWVQPVT